MFYPYDFYLCQNLIASPGAVAESTAASDFKPTRRVRDPPGGVTHAIFGGADDDGALSTAPPKPSATVSLAWAVRKDLALSYTCTVQAASAAPPETSTTSTEATLAPAPAPER